jgi:ribonuclease P protein component
MQTTPPSQLAACFDSNSTSAAQKQTKPVKSANQLVPLKGSDNFSRLMYTKPRSAWGQCLVHAIATQKTSLENQAKASPQMALGLIVPKKAYALAVDRNRIRRVLRAHSFNLIKELPFPIQVLFRIKSTLKKGSPKKKALTHEAFVAVNPHSAAFSLAVQDGLSKAISALVEDQNRLLASETP